MRLIDADSLKKEISKTIECIAKKQGGTEEGSFAVGMCLAFKTMISKQPTAEAKPIIHAHWEEYDDSAHWYCSNCGQPSALDETVSWSKYCPICGAQMDEEEKE